MITEILSDMNYNLYEVYGIVIFEFGNSRLKIVTDEQVQFVDYSFLDLSNDDLNLILNQVNAILNKLEYKIIYYSSVNFNLSNFVSSKIEMENINNLIDNLMIDFSEIEGMGIDRKLGLIAAGTFIGNNVVTIDCGTAQTYNIMIKNKCEGGFITPGLHTRINSIFTKTNIKEIKSRDFNLNFGKNTKEAIYNGVFFGIIEEIYGVINIIKSEYLADIKFVMTGGNSSIIFNALNKNDFSLILQTNLVTDGIKVLLSKKYDKQ